MHPHLDNRKLLFQDLLAMHTEFFWKPAKTVKDMLIYGILE